MQLRGQHPKPGPTKSLLEIGWFVNEVVCSFEIMIANIRMHMTVEGKKGNHFELVLERCMRGFHHCTPTSSHDRHAG